MRHAHACNLNVAQAAVWKHQHRPYPPYIPEVDDDRRIADCDKPQNTMHIGFQKSDGRLIFGYSN
jgi:hypothetical protein